MMRHGVKDMLAIMAMQTATSPPMPMALTSGRGIISKQQKQQQRVIPA